MFEVKNSVCGYDGREVIRNVSFTAEAGEVICILGANGVGKTTLFRSMLGTLPLLKGDIFLDGKSVSGISGREFAKRVGYVPQAHMPPFPFTVTDVVIMGRTAHLSVFSSPGREDEKIARQVMQDLNITYLADRVYTEISGGERQLVLIARALAQQPAFLIMDEPTSNLDFGNQFEILMQIKELAQRGLSVVLTTHYPDHAFICASKVVAVISADNCKVGTPQEIITDETLKEIYGIDVSVCGVSSHGKDATVCIPWSGRRARSNQGK